MKAGNVIHITVRGELRVPISDIKIVFNGDTDTHYAYHSMVASAPETLVHDLDHPDCQVAEVGSAAWMGTGDNPYRPRYLARLMCLLLDHDWYTTPASFARCRRCKRRA